MEVMTIIFLFMVVKVSTIKLIFPDYSQI